jgi:hypothetical protein
MDSSVTHIGEGRRKREEGRGKREEGIRKRETEIVNILLFPRPDCYSFVA